MKAFLGDAKLKTLLVKEIENHRKTDQIMKGTYGNEQMGKWRGCAVGCSIHSLNLKLGKNFSTSNHSIYEEQLGIPRQLAYLEDRIFENLPDDEALFWPTRFMKAITPGADLKDVIGKFMVWMLVDKNDGVIKFAKKDTTKKVIQDVADLYVRKNKGEIITTEQWLVVRNAAYAAYAAYAAAYAAYAAAYAAAADAYADAYAAAYAAYAAAYAADADAYADAYAAAYAAYAAAYAAAAYADADAAYAAYAAAAYADADAYAAADAARKKHFSLMAEKLISLLKEAK